MRCYSNKYPSIYSKGRSVRSKKEIAGSIRLSFMQSFFSAGGDIDEKEKDNCFPYDICATFLIKFLEISNK